MPNIILNGKQKQVEPKTTLTGLLTLLDISPDTVVIEHNQVIVKRKLWSEIILKESDQIEIISFVGGG